MTIELDEIADAIIEDAELTEPLREKDSAPPLYAPPSSLKLDPTLRCENCIKFSPPWCFEHHEIYPHTNPNAIACRQYEERQK